MTVDNIREIERAHEAKYKLDEELRFKIQCRRNKLLGAWAAMRMGMATADGDVYAKRLVAMALERPGLSPVIETVAADLAAAGVTVDRGDLLAAAEQCESQATTSLANDYPQALGADHLQIGG